MPEPLAIYSATNTTWSLVKEIYGYIESFAKANTKAESIRLRFYTTQTQARVFIDFFKDNEKDIAADHAASIIAASDKLKGSLGDVRSKIKTYDPKTWRRIQWPWVEKSLDEAERSLADWVRRLLTTFMMLPDSLKQRIVPKIVSPAYLAETDPLAALRAHIEIRQKQKDLRNTNRQKLLETLAPEPEDDDVTRTFYWKDEISIPANVRVDEKALQDFKVEVAKLVEVLKGVPPKLAYIPRACSWFQPSTDTLGIAYKIPNTVGKTHTLDDMVRQPAHHTLTSRLTLAIQIATAVSYIHGLEWVHKTIRSSNILLVYDRADLQPPAGLGRASLRGFRIARRGTSDARSTNVEQDNKSHWQKQIYSHPRRQVIHIQEEEQLFYDAHECSAEVQLAAESEEFLSPHASDRGHLPISADTAAPWDAEPKPEFYKYKHDVYSVGVVLLELGIWEDLTLDTALKTLKPEARRQRLREVASVKLGARMGQRYSEVVKACLDVDDSKWDIQRVLSELYDIRI